MTFCYNHPPCKKALDTREKYPFMPHYMIDNTTGELRVGASTEKCYIYGLRDPKTNEVFYIGRTKHADLSIRLRGHLAKKYEKHNPPLAAKIKEIISRGEKPEIFLIEKNANDMREDQLIYIYMNEHPILNIKKSDYGLRRRLFLTTGKSERDWEFIAPDFDIETIIVQDKADNSITKEVLLKDLYGVEVRKYAKQLYDAFVANWESKRAS